jgi:hypothetical protein
MADESLAELGAAFAAWRRRKRHVREAVPGDLLARARSAARHHGPAAVGRVTGVQRHRLVVARVERSKGAGRSSATASMVPAYSRVEIARAAASSSTRPFAEVEAPSGLRVRLFIESGEALGLLTALLGAGGAR